MARAFKMGPQVSTQYVKPQAVKRTPKAQPIPAVKRVTPPKINNAYAAWTDSNLIRTLTLSKPVSCETRVINETRRIKEALRVLLLFARDCEQNLDLNTSRVDAAVALIKQASDCVQIAHNELTEAIIRK